MRALLFRMLPSGIFNYLRSKRRRSRTKALINAINKQFPDHTIRALDVGARFGIEENSIFAPIREFAGLHLIGIEPDKAEASRLMTGVNGRYAKIHEVAVADTPGQRTLYLTKHPGCSSILPPAPGAVDRLICRDFFQVVETMQIEVTTLDQLFAGRERFDIVKLDVQGVEHEVLSGGRELLSSAIGINLEAQLTPLYSGQALFPAIHEQLLGMGFNLINMEPRDAIYDGNVVEVECGYARQLSEQPTQSELLNQLLFACLYGNTAYCQLLLRQAAESDLREVASRLAKAAHLSIAPAATPKEWLS